ncbi:MAG TPA: hypothetical protein VN636_21140 [Acidimicrobiia bacterium]|nr:hypothetical protein [Acidimicrobiia bacterium]
MSPTTHDDIEQRVRELFDRQAAGVDTEDRAWDDVPVAWVGDLEVHGNRRRRTGRGIAAVAAVAAAAVLVAVLGSGERTTRVSTGARAGNPLGTPGTAVSWETNQVELHADAFRIDADGKRFTAQNAHVEVFGDPGDAHYQTLELRWTEHAVEMRLSIYFASDANRWWATQIATYDGTAPGGWISYAGHFFATPLLATYTGNLDLRSGTAALHFTNLRLRAFRPSPACAQQTGAFAVQANDSNISVPVGSGMGYATYATLFDRATCTPVTDAQRYRMTWTAADPALLTVKAQDCLPEVRASLQCAANAYVDFSAAWMGRTTVHLAAIDRETNRVVAATDVPIATVAASG